ncbi:hypothetical protein A3C73_03945 [Candidatus Giovannonibacteria bacterium RIFCSPHIGHO2_02_FULL_44_11]|nr:MAG: hypothetical protein A3C73_03945 [Candidatus Giovannonibacteria bacterium RIFCSPHIGHO2_02_FULL_44_11]
MAYLVKEHMDRCGFVCAKCKKTVVSSFSGQGVRMEINEADFSKLQRHQETCKGTNRKKTKVLS